MDLPVEIITRPSHLYAAIQEMGNSRAIAVDTEANSRHRYPEQLCLVQIATLNKIFIIDTILLKEIDSLRDILLDASIVKVFHTAGYDILSLNRHFGFQIRGVFDAAIAARFTGISKFALAIILEDLLGITIKKNRRIQEGDWGRRPLSTEALEYAASDVRHLLALREFLDKRLQELGRISWVTEECTRLEELRYEPWDLETAFLSLKGANKLDGSSLAILKPLYLFREKEALKQNRPPYYVIPHNTLLYLATNPEADLSKTPGLGKTGLKRFGQDLQEALEKGLAAAPIYRSSRAITEELNEEELQSLKLARDERDQRLKRLKDWRTSIGILLSLDPSLVWPRVSLERLSRDPDTLEVELTSSDICRWQHEQFASSLNVLVESL